MLLIKTKKHFKPVNDGVVIKKIPKDITITKSGFHLHNPKPSLDESGVVIAVGAKCQEDVKALIGEKVTVIRYGAPFDYELDGDHYFVCKAEHLLFSYT